MFGKVVGGILGTVAFSVACIVGLLAGNDVTTVLARGLVAMLVFFVIGFLIGTMGRKLVDEHMQRIVETDRQAQLARMNESAESAAEGRPAPGEKAGAENQQAV